jgi:hypothetical protein
MSGLIAALEPHGPFSNSPDSDGESPMILAQHPAGETGGKNLDMLLHTA